MGGLAELVKAANEIDDLGGVNRDDISVYCDFRHQNKHQHHTKHRIQNVDLHNIQLLVKALEHSVGGHIQIHDRDQRSDQGNKIGGIRGFIDHKAQLLGEDQHHGGCDHGKNDGDVQNAVDDIILLYAVIPYLALCNFRDQKAG